MHLLLLLLLLLLPKDRHCYFPIRMRATGQGAGETAARMAAAVGGSL